MEQLGRDSGRVVILGAGEGGSSMLELLLQDNAVDIVAIVDRNPEAPGLARAAELEIPIFYDIAEALVSSKPCIAFNLTEDEAVETVASDILGVGCVVGGLAAKLMWKMVTDLRHAKVRLEFQAAHDELTDLYNRRHMLNEMERGLHQAIRYGMPFSLALIDLDQFKRVNDLFGHAAGDMVLKHTAQLLRRNIRAADVIGRWGGEEFLVLLPHCTADDALRAVNKWLGIIQQRPVAIPAGESIRVSFSAGIVAYQQEDASADVSEVIDRLLARADERLYAAKHAGRACVVGMTDL